MKKSLITLSILISFGALAESNNGHPNNNPQQPSGTNTTIGNTNSSGSNSNSLAGAAAISGSQSQGIGVSGSLSGSTSTSGPSNSSSDSNSASNSSSEGGHSYSALTDSSKSFSFAAPVFTIIPGTDGKTCIVSKSRAFSVAILFSHSKSSQESEVVCTLLRMAEAAKRVCRFKHADFLEEQAFKIMVPGVAWPRMDNVADLDHVACTVLYGSMPK